VRVDGATIIDLFRSERDGENLDHFCLVMPAADWEAMVAAGTVPVVRGPSQVFGARGMGMSVYTTDPDGNTVELRRYDD
jgi:extradiol dioxygenase family protein